MIELQSSRLERSDCRGYEPVRCVRTYGLRGIWMLWMSRGGRGESVRPWLTEPTRFLVIDPETDMAKLVECQSPSRRDREEWQMKRGEPVVRRRE